MTHATPVDPDRRAPRPGRRRAPASTGRDRPRVIFPVVSPSIALAPPTADELRDLRRIGREAPTFDGMSEDVMRVQLTLAVMPPRADPEALRGLRRRERLLLLEAFSLGTAGPDELRLAAALTRCVADEGDNLIPMLAAALEADCMRQGFSAEPSRPGFRDA